MHPVAHMPGVAATVVEAGAVEFRGGRRQVQRWEKGSSDVRIGGAGRGRARWPSSWCVVRCQPHPARIADAAPTAAGDRGGKWRGAPPTGLIRARCSPRTNASGSFKVDGGGTSKANGVDEATLSSLSRASRFYLCMYMAAEHAAPAPSAPHHK